MTSVRRRLPPSMCSYVCLINQVKVGLFLGTNVPMLSGVHQLVMHAFNTVDFVIFCSPIEYLYIFKVLGKTMTGYTWNLTVH